MEKLASDCGQLGASKRKFNIKLARIEGIGGSGSDPHVCITFRIEHGAVKFQVPIRLGIRYCDYTPPFDPATGEVIDAPIERQTELVLEQMKLCLETAGSSLEKVLKCNVYCTSVEKFAAVNTIYSRYFPEDPPARIFVNVLAWPLLIGVSSWTPTC